MKHTISGLVKNRAGILKQLVGAFKGSALNIKSVAVSETDLFETSRLTIVVEGQDKEVKQATVAGQEVAGRAPDRRSVAAGVSRPGVGPGEGPVPPRGTQSTHADGRGLRRQVIAMGKQSITFEIAGEEERVDGFINALNSFGIRGLARSGRVALKGGDEV